MGSGPFWRPALLSHLSPGYDAGMTQLQGQIVVVTGGARGIGRAIAEAFARSQATVLVLDRDLAPAEEVAAAIQRSGGKAAAFALDVADGTAFDALAPELERRHGPVDVLVNNAGIMSLGGFLDQPRARDQAQLRVNLEGVMNGMRAFLPGMKARGRGHIVNIASVAGRVGTPYAAVYSASKFAVIGLTEAVRAELDGSGVSFSYVMPSLVATDLIAGAGRPAWPKVATPEDVAAAVLDAVLTKKVDVYVPKATRISAILPAILPRPLLEWVGRKLKVDQIFAVVDAQARSAYSQRLDQNQEPRPPSEDGPFGPTPRARA